MHSNSASYFSAAETNSNNCEDESGKRHGAQTPNYDRKWPLIANKKWSRTDRHYQTDRQNKTDTLNDSTEPFVAGCWPKSHPGIPGQKFQNLPISYPNPPQSLPFDPTYLLGLVGMDG